MKRHLLYAGIILLCLISIPSYPKTDVTLPVGVKEPTIQLKQQEKPPKKISRAKRLRDERKKKRSERKSISHKTYDELKKEKIARVAAKDNEGALRYLEKMVPLCNDLAELKTIMLELADLLFTLESYSKAADMYREFITLYPGSDEVEYATYQAIVSNFKLTLDAEHDQSKTIATKELAHSFLERQDLFTTHKKDVEEILAKCEEKLLATEENIVNFYLKLGNTKSAQRRLEGIKKEFLDKTIPDVNLRIAQLESAVGSQQIAIEPVKLASETLTVVQADKPESDSETQKPFVDRF